MSQEIQEKPTERISRINITRELVKPKEAARYWQIIPEATDSKKVVSFAG